MQLLIFFVKVAVFREEGNFQLDMSILSPSPIGPRQFFIFPEGQISSNFVAFLM